MVVGILQTHLAVFDEVGDADAGRATDAHHAVHHDPAAVADDAVDVVHEVVEVRVQVLVAGITQTHPEAGHGDRVLEFAQLDGKVQHVRDVVMGQDLLTGHRGHPTQEKSLTDTTKWRALRSSGSVHSGLHSG